MDFENAEFPYYKDFVSLEEIQTDFENLKIYHPDKETVGSFYSIILNYEKEKRFNRLSDYFVEDVRIKSVFNNKKTPFDYFTENKKRIFSYSGLGNNPTYKKIDSYLFKNTKSCSNFSPVVSSEIYKFFKPTKILDFSSGWGDRLIAAISNDISYTGYDPNSKLVDKYQEIIRTFNGDPEKYKMVCECFEEADIEKETFDLVFSSPPFYCLEKYSDEKTQSIEKYKTFTEWKEKFLFATYTKSIHALKINGFMAIYINDFRDYKIITDTFSFLKKIKNVSYKGFFTWKGDSYPKKIFVWKKTK